MGTAIPYIANWAIGSWDIHVHASPSLFERWGTAAELAAICQAAGMKGFILKLHHGSSVELASLLNDQFGDLVVYGGLTLNYFAGGLNPLAVEAALQVGAKVIWLPTIHAAYHEQALGTLGGFPFQGSVLQHTPKTGISVIDEADGIVPAMKAILDLLHNQPTVLATGHISPKEIAALVGYIERNNLNIRLLVNHVFFTAPGLSIAQLRELQRDWVWFETVQLCIAPMVACASIEQVAQGINELPDAHWILATDSGQKENVTAPEAISSFASQLHQQGIPATTIRRMLRDAPEALLAS